MITTGYGRLTGYNGYGRLQQVTMGYNRPWSVMLKFLFIMLIALKPCKPFMLKIMLSNYTQQLTVLLEFPDCLEWVMCFKLSDMLSEVF